MAIQAPLGQSAGRFRHYSILSARSIMQPRCQLPLLAHFPVSRCIAFAQLLNSWSTNRHCRAAWPKKEQHISAACQNSFVPTGCRSLKKWGIRRRKLMNLVRVNGCAALYCAGAPPTHHYRGYHHHPEQPSQLSACFGSLVMLPEHP